MTIESPAHFLIVGRIVGVHGVRGQVKVFSDCRPRESIFSYHTFEAISTNGHDMRTLTLVRGNHSGKSLVASFAEITDRDAAAALNGYVLRISRDQLPPTPEGEFYWADLIGLQVENREGKVLGIVKDLFETGANDVLVVENHQEELLIPFVRPQYIEKIDLSAGIISVDWESDWLKPTAADQE